MAMNPDDRDVPQLRRLQDWWLELPLSYRLNALLYFLGGCFLLFLVTSLLRGDDEPRQIQVGAGVTPTTTPTAPGATVRAGPATTVAGSTSPSSAPSTTAAGGGVGAGGGGGATTTRSPSPTTAAPATTTTAAPTTAAPAPTTTASPGPTLGTTPPSTAAPTTTAPRCRNSTDQSCGQFSWTPPPNGQRLEIRSELSENPRVNVPMTFRITVTDPDHTIGTCAFLDFGDLSSSGNCPDPPCPARYGPWDLPAPGGPGSFTFTFTHTYQSPGPFIATFLVDDRTDCWDPYGERQTKPIPVVLG